MTRNIPHDHDEVVSFSSLPDDLLVSILSWIAPPPQLRWVWYGRVGAVNQSLRKIVTFFFQPGILDLNLLFRDTVWFLDHIDTVPRPLRKAFVRSFVDVPTKGTMVKEFRIGRWDSALKTYVRRLLTKPSLFPNLEAIYFGRGDEETFSITPRFLFDVGTAHPDLTRLTLFHCLSESVEVTTEDLHAIAGSMPKIRTFRLKDSTNGFLDNAGLEQLSRQWPDLQELELTVFRRSSLVTDQGLVRMARNWKHLRVVQLKLANITWNGLDRLLEANQNIEVLNLSDCARLGPGAIDTIVKHVPKLRVFHAHGCHWMDDERLDRLVGPDSCLRTIGLDNTLVTPAGLRRVLTKKPRFLGKAPTNSLAAAIDIGYFVSSLEMKIPSIDPNGMTRQTINKQWLELAKEFEINFAINRFEECRAGATTTSQSV